MPDVRQSAWADISFEQARHVDVEERFSLSVLEKQDGVGDVLAHGRDIGQFHLDVREYAVPIRSVDGEFL